MPWATSNRRATLPKDWSTIRRRIKARADGICEWRDTHGNRCTSQGTDCHHTGRSNDHSDENLMWICRTHHDMVTKQQAKAAQHARYVTAKKRQPEQHPGIRTPGAHTLRDL